MRRLLCRTALPVILAAAVASNVSAAIVINGGFELGTGTDADNWGEFSGPNGTTTRSNADPFSGGFSAYIQFDNSTSNAAGAYFIEQNLGANTLNPLVDHNLTFRAKVDSTSFIGHDAFAQIQWLDQDGSNGGGFKGQEFASLIGLGINTNYQEFSFLNMNVPDDADSFLVRFQLSAGAVQDPGNVNGLYVDNVVLTAVPEPSSAALLALVSLGAIGIRRRKS